MNLDPKLLSTLCRGQGVCLFHDLCVSLVNSFKARYRFYPVCKAAGFLLGSVETRFLEVYLPTLVL